MPAEMPRSNPSEHTELVGVRAAEQLLNQLGFQVMDWSAPDKGIDLLAALRDAETSTGTPFMAGFQVKSGPSYATGIQVQSHRDYWLRATVPVFVLWHHEGEVLVEDTSVLGTDRDLTQLRPTIKLTDAALRVRLRCRARALYPELVATGPLSSLVEYSEDADQIAVAEVVDSITDALTDPTHLRPLRIELKVLEFLASCLGDPNEKAAVRSYLTGMGRQHCLEMTDAAIQRFVADHVLNQLQAASFAATPADLADVDDVIGSQSDLERYQAVREARGRWRVDWRHTNRDRIVEDLVAVFQATSKKPGEPDGFAIAEADLGPGGDQAPDAAMLLALMSRHRAAENPVDEIRKDLDTALDEIVPQTLRRLNGLSPEERYEINPELSTQVARFSHPVDMTPALTDPGI